jgi:hypothetical protein
MRSLFIRPETGGMGDLGLIAAWREIACCSQAEVIATADQLT